MPSKAVLIIAGLTGLASVTGATYAVMQSSPPANTPVLKQTAASSPTPNPTQSPPPQVSPPELILPAGTKTGSVSASSQDVLSCKISMAKIADPNPPANVRSSPNSQMADNIVGKIENGTFVSVASSQDNWFKISQPIEGWIASNITQSGCNQKVVKINLNKRNVVGGQPLEITDDFIGAGSHVYQIRGFSPAEKVIVTSQQGPLPRIVGPDQREMTGMDDGQKVWSGVFTAQGMYQFSMDSNYKGYKYAFSIEIK